MKKHYYFYKKDDNNFNDVVIVDNDYQLNNLHLIEGDFYEIDSEITFKQKLSQSRKEDFDRLNFSTGFYKVIKTVDPDEINNFTQIHLKEIETVLLNVNRNLSIGEQILVKNIPYEVVNLLPILTIGDQLSEGYDLKNILTEEHYQLNKATLIHNNTKLIL